MQCEAYVQQQYTVTFFSFKNAPNQYSKNILNIDI